MTRGRRPYIGLKEAKEIAAKRGDIWVLRSKRGDEFDLMIFEEHRTILVKVQRSVTQMYHPLEVLAQYRRGIARLHRMPLTVVTAREFWVRHPKGMWQFFLIRHDSIIEIRADGTYIPRAELPMRVPEPPGEDPSSGEEDFTLENDE
jgi:hypothetical protein